MRFRQTLFWDVDPKTIDPKKHAYYVIDRILHLGTDREIRWMWRTYGPVRIREVIEHRRGVDAQTRALWELLTASKPTR